MTEGLMERLEILIARSMENLTESLKAEENSTDCKKSKLKDRRPAPQPTGSVSDPPTRDLQKELDCSRNTGQAKENRKKKSQPSPNVLGASAGLNMSRASAHPSNDESGISVKAEKNSTDCKNSNIEDRKPVPQPTGFVSDLQKELSCSRNTGHAKKNRKKKSQPSPKVVDASAGLNVSRASAHPSNDESGLSDRRLEILIASSMSNLTESVKAEENSTDCKNSNIEDRKPVPQPTDFVSDLQKELNCSRNTGHAKKNRKKKSQRSPKVVGASEGLNVTRASAHPSNDASSISDRRELQVDGFVDGVSIHNNCSQNMGHATKDCNMQVVLPGASTWGSKASHAGIDRANYRPRNHRTLQTRKFQLHGKVWKRDLGKFDDETSAVRPIDAFIFPRATFLSEIDYSPDWWKIR